MTKFLNAKELKEQASIVDLLAKLGYRPVPKHGREKMYYSMLRDDDSDPSFAVNDELGVWFDHGTRKGGNIIDFGLAYWKGLSFTEVVEKIQDTCAIVLSDTKPHRPRKAVKIPHYIIQEIKDLGTHPAITNYLKDRRVFHVAKDLLSEVYYYVEDQKGLRKHFFAAGWKNDNGSWEVRNRFFKGCLGPKAITCLPGHSKNVAVFEGCINYLSWRAQHPESDHSIIVLNSLTLLQYGIGAAKGFSAIDVFFDRDKGGHIATKEFIKALPYASDRSKVYDGFNDYNDMLKSVADSAINESMANTDFFKNVKVPFSR